MTALLNLVHLHRYALPEHFIARTKRAATCQDAPRPSTPPRRRAAWQLAPDGRLYCVWTLGIGDSS